MFKRKIYSKMLNWKQESDGKTALLIEGARRIGKSTVVEEFAKKEYESYILIDFAKASSDVKALFDDISDLNYLFLQLQLQYRVDLHERKSVIIFDEVQLCPKARQAIKALVEDHRYDYIETGSLISIKKNVKDGDIILMHDIHPTTVEALKKVLPWLVKNDYDILTVSELAKRKGAVMHDGKAYGGFTGN